MLLALKVILFIFISSMFLGTSNKNYAKLVEEFSANRIVVFFNKINFVYGFAEPAIHCTAVAVFGDLYYLEIYLI